MNVKEDIKWQLLLSSSASVFAGEETPLYGFLTSTLARLKEEKKRQEQLEKISLRALFASMAALAITAVITLSLHFQNPSDLEPGMRSLIQVENVQVS
jgi:hypothetical protein